MMIEEEVEIYFKGKKESVKVFSHETMGKVYTGDADKIKIKMDADIKAKVDKFEREEFEKCKVELKGLSFQGKLDWYANRDPLERATIARNPYFKKYWQAKVVWRINLLRLYYKIKNRQLFKKYEHISSIKEARKKVKKHSI